MKLRDDMRWGPLDEQTVADFEARNGIELPVDFRAFLLAHHGGVPDPSFYWAVANNTPDRWGSDIASLYGFGPQEYSLQEHLDTRESMGVDLDMLVIGDDGCCSLLTLGITGPRTGQVFYIDHSFAPGEPGHELFLASTFEEFLEQLCDVPDE